MRYVARLTPARLNHTDTKNHCRDSPAYSSCNSATAEQKNDNGSTERRSFSWARRSWSLGKARTSTTANLFAIS